jgi:hypothetical protein
MRIAFDLDDTLIPCGHRFPVEKPTWLARWFSTEPLRLGAVELCKQLRALGCDIWIYTTSQRPPLSIWFHFFAYGIRLAGIVNQDRHRRRLTGGYPDPRDCSKYPPAFGIHLLFDDSEGVVMEGRRYHFRAVRIPPDQNGWTAVVLHEVEGSLKV